MSVLKEILKWSVDRPPWQRDALRRLVTVGALEASDIADLSRLCKSRHGLANGDGPAPLNASHLPQPGATRRPVTLTSLIHRGGVNALVQDQTIQFGPSLTVVYGANAAGKSGYTRILKRACRARGAEEILGNVTSGSAPGRPAATICFRVGDTSSDYLWTDDGSPNPALSRVSVFDRHCASVYVSQRTDVAFRPLGLDLFDKLSDACEAVKKTLEKERNTLESQSLPALPTAPGTAAYNLVTNLTSLTDPSTVTKLATLSEADAARRRELQARIRDLESGDPAKVARAIELQVKRMTGLVHRVNVVTDTLSSAAINDLFLARDHYDKVRQVADELQKTTFREQPVAGTGSDRWRTLWDAAGRFSAVDAYPDRDFPHTADGSRCVLCQQALSVNGARRLRQFKEFLDSAVQSDRDAAENQFRQKHNHVAELVVIDNVVTEALDELQIEEVDLAASVRSIFGHAESCRKRVAESLDGGPSNLQELVVPTFDTTNLVTYIDGLKDRARQLREPNHRQTVRKLREELSELDARQVLADNVDKVLEAIERKKRIAAYQLCIEETRTNAITRKSTEVTKRAVTEKLATSFAVELKALNFRHVEVQMVDSGGSRGALYHKLQLRRAPGVDVSKVVSEGEARCLSIASFFAELCTAADRSAILFDDPVSSLDHNWRENVAARLVAESRSRQVIVFTHDIVFLLALSQKAEAAGVSPERQYLRRERIGAGLSSSRLPWPAMKVKDRIGYLKDLWQGAEKTFRVDGSERYEREAQHIYGLLREAWERAVEEVLLVGIVERYRSSVQTQQVGQLADISTDDCGALDAGMTKCSRWLSGHDKAAAENTPFPEPREVEGDIKALEKWVQVIRSRRSK